MPTSVPNNPGGGELERTARRRALYAVLGGPLLGVACAGTSGVPVLPPYGSASATAGGAALAASSGGVLPAASSRPVAAPTSPPIGSGAIGGAFPTLLGTVATDGSWLTLCQADHDDDGDGQLAVTVGARGELGGDGLSARLVRGDGPGEPIDAVYAHDESGRYLVVARAGRAELIDVRSDAVVDLSALGADVRDDVAPQRAHRAFSFDARGQWLAYVRREGAKSRVALRQLADGRERLIDPGAGELWRIAIDASGSWLRLDVVSADSDGDGRLEWPARERSTPRPVCASPVATFTAASARGDLAEARYAPVVDTSSAPAVAIPNVVMTLGGSLVLRAQDGALERTIGGPATPMTPAGCGARVLYGDLDRKQLLVACPLDKGGRPGLHLYAAGVDVPLGITLSSAPGDALAAGSERLVPLYAGTDTVLVDLARRDVISLRRNDVPIAVSAQRALIQRGTSLYVYDADVRSEQALTGAVDRVALTLLAAPFVVVSPLLVDFTGPTVVGNVTGRPLALTPDGHVLMAEGGDGDGQKLATGPLRWRTVGR